MKKGDRVRLLGNYPNYPNGVYATIIRKGHKGHWVINIDGDTKNVEWNEKRLEEVKNKQLMKLSHKIVELFEDLLDEKDIEVPCNDLREQKERHEGNNESKLYGTEYWTLIEKVENLLTNVPCRICTNMGGTDGIIIFTDNGDFVVESDALNKYLEEYSME